MAIANSQKNVLLGHTVGVVVDEMYKNDPMPLQVQGSHLRHLSWVAGQDSIRALCSTPSSRRGGLCADCLSVMLHVHSGNSDQRAVAPH